MLTARDIAELARLLRAAIASEQLSLQVGSPILPGEDDEFGDGDRHDGNSTNDNGCLVTEATSYDDDDTELTSVIITIPDSSVAYLAGLVEAPR